MKIAATAFFKLARATQEQAFTVGLLRSKSDLVSPGLLAGDTVSANVQHQIIALFYDKMLRAKKADKMRDLLHVCPAENNARCTF